MAEIDIGEVAENRSTNIGSGYTLINKGNPANASGVITSVEIWAYANLGGCRVGTFYTTNGNTLKCRDSVAIGNVTAGSKQTFPGLSITVVAGDYIGMYYTSGIMEADNAGYSGIWYIAQEQIDPGDEATYTFLANYAISLYGTGVIPETHCGAATLSGTGSLVAKGVLIRGGKATLSGVGSLTAKAKVVFIEPTVSNTGFAANYDKKLRLAKRWERQGIDAWGEYFS